MTNPQRLYLPVVIDPEYNYEAINVETQTKNPSSLLWWMRRMISLRKRYKAFGRGSLEFTMLDNPKVLAFIRSYGKEIILVLANFSRFTQMVEINRTKFAGYYMEDLFSRNSFPVIKDSPYVVMLGPYDYFLLQLKKGSAAVQTEEEAVIPEIKVGKKWQDVLEGIAKERLEREILPAYLEKYRRSIGKRGPVSRTRIVDAITVTINEAVVVMLFLDVTHAGGDTAVVLLPLHFAAQDAGRRITEESAWAVIARLSIAGYEGILCDAVINGEFRQWLFEMIARRKRVKVKGGVLTGHQGKALKKILADTKPQGSQILHDDPVDTAILFDNFHFFKLYRQVAEGIHPEAEIGRFLTDTVDFAGSAPFAGTLEYNRPGAEPITLGLLQGYIPNQGEAMTLTMEELSRYFEQLLSKKAEIEAVLLPASGFDVDIAALPDTFRELTGEFYLEMVALLGRRTGELHLALSSDPEQGDFAPEPFSRYHQRSVYQAAKSLVRKAVLLLGRSLDMLPDEIRPEAERVLAAEQEIQRLLEKFLGTRFTSSRIRVHGNYNLRQVLFTGKDFMIIDFAGEPAQVMVERRIKRSPLHDVAGMMRSLYYAAYDALLQKTDIRGRDIHFLEPWAQVWYRYVSGIFLKSYLTTVSGAGFVPWERDDLEVMLSAYMLRKALSSSWTSWKPPRLGRDPHKGD
jgi:maltose alpha-D-glucosyltransferase/alpha-amylase